MLRERIRQNIYYSKNQQEKEGDGLQATKIPEKVAANNKTSEKVAELSMSPINDLPAKQPKTSSPYKLGSFFDSTEEIIDEDLEINSIIQNSINKTGSLVVSAGNILITFKKSCRRI